MCVDVIITNPTCSDLCMGGICTLPQMNNVVWQVRMVLKDAGTFINNSNSILYDKNR